MRWPPHGFGYETLADSDTRVVDGRSNAADLNRAGDTPGTSLRAIEGRVPGILASEPYEGDTEQSRKLTNEGKWNPI